MELDNFSIGGQQESQEDVEMTVSQEALEHQSIEEEEKEFTDMSEATKARKRKKRKHHRSGGRKSVMDGTKYYDREEYIPQYWPNPNSCPTENVVTPAQSKVQNPSCDCIGYGAGLRIGHATSGLQNLTLKQNVRNTKTFVSPGRRRKM